METLYLESGNIPIRFILISRRLNFLHYILNEDDESLLRTFFTAKRESPVRGDWVMMVTEDIKELGIDLKIRNEFIGKYEDYGSYETLLYHIWSNVYILTVRMLNVLLVSPIYH